MENQELKERALAFIRSNNAMVVATATKKGEPHAATVYFDVDDDFSFYFITSAISRKALNLKDNDGVAFVIGFGPQLVTVQGGGKATSFEISADFFEKFLDRIEPEEPVNWPLLRINKDSFSAFKIKPDWLVWLSLDKDGHPETYSTDHHKLI